MWLLLILCPYEEAVPPVTLGWSRVHIQICISAKKGGIWSHTCFLKPGEKAPQNIYCIAVELKGLIKAGASWLNSSWRWWDPRHWVWWWKLLLCCRAGFTEVGKNSVCQESCTSEEKSPHEPHSCRFPSFGTLNTLQLDAPISSGKHLELLRCKVAQIACWSDLAALEKEHESLSYFRCKMP